MEAEGEARKCPLNMRIGGKYELFEPWSGRRLDKTHEATAGQDWGSRLADTQELPKSIGADEEISKTMGGTGIQTSKRLRKDHRDLWWRELGTNLKPRMGWSEQC